jgi:hypothetical protein
MEKKYDLFISHATEDKDEIVRPIAECLTAFGIGVWFDEFALTLGDSIARSIDKGLINSEFGLIILSPAFLEKYWTEHELRGLISKSIGEEKAIIPIWHNISFENVRNYSPTLADIKAIDTSDNSITEICIEIIKAIRPDIYKNLIRYLTWIKLTQSGEIQRKKVGELIPGNIKHKELPIPYMIRIKIIWHTIKEFGFSLEELLDNFKRDIDPGNELAIWERIIAAYLDITSEIKIDSNNKSNIFYKLLEYSISSEDELIEINEIGDQWEKFLLHKYLNADKIQNN